ncbi:uncharacterized protein [Ptychodera flava]|uniref:uncharacterized protein n=1 Tax=Ptychodera flava TaxID=63121 RepID=UPI00396A462E
MLRWSQSSALIILLGFYTSVFGVQAVEVRLSGGRTSSEGIVQIRSSEETKWRLVCGNIGGWNVKIAICKHQGYGTADKNYPWTVTGNVSSELQSSLAVCDIQCNADAELIEQCNISWKENGIDCTCERGRPMGVTCIMSTGTSLKRGSDMYLFIGMGVVIAIVTIFSFLVLILGIRQRKSPIRENERTANPSNFAALHVEGSPISSNAYVWTEQGTFDISDFAGEEDPGDPNTNTDHKLETFTPEDVQNVSADLSGGGDLRVDSAQDGTSTQDYFSSAYDMLGPPNLDEGQQSAPTNATINNDQHFSRSGDQYDLYETVDMRKESTVNTSIASADDSKMANTENIDDLYATVDKSKKAAGRSLSVASDDVNESTESENATTKRKTSMRTSVTCTQRWTNQRKITRNNTSRQYYSRYQLLYHTSIYCANTAI